MLVNNSHHCIYLQHAWNKYGQDNFDFIIIKECITEEDARNEEQFHLDNYRDQIYNLSYCATGGDIISNHPKRNEIISKRSKTVKLKNIKLTNEERKIKFSYNKMGIKNGMYGKHHSEESKLKISITQKNNPIEGYRKNKTFEELFGKEKANELKEQLSHNASLRVGEKNSFYGKHHSDETKKILSEKRKGKTPTNITPVVIDNIRYESLNDASIKLHIPVTTIRWRVQSNNKKFDNYKYE